MTWQKIFSSPTLIIILALLAGVFGAWSFVALVTEYQPNYSVQEAINNPNAQVVIRDPKKVVVEQDNKAVETVNSVEHTLAGIFKANPAGLYDLTQSVGQAAIITSDGWLLTNFTFANQDEVALSKNYVVVTKDRNIYQIDGLTRDQASGFVFIHVAEARDLPVSRFAKASQLQAGQLVIGVNWYGPAWLANVSQVNYQTEQSSEAGIKNISLTSQPQSGLAVADLSGNIIGLVKEQEVKSANYVLAVINDLLAKKTIDQAYLGVQFQNLNLLVGRDSKHGAYLTKIASNSPAAAAGLQAGDIITAIDGFILNGGDDLAEVILDYDPGEVIVVNYLRNNKQSSLEVALGSR